ncbi:hypothetical protein [Granulicella aggregans]|uniref:hypothetical protein n=1 Tax=Granulicella aggregans TaxID=474949 RepID=UPI0021E08696|nr:hypothetical protein [Granulicella aggregans]
MTKRGRVLRDTNIGPGLLTVEGKQYSFLLEGMWRSEVSPRPGMTVDVNFDSDGAPAEVFAVSESQIAKEQAQRAFSGALRHGEALGGAVTGAIGASVAGGLKRRLGPLTIAAEVILLLAFFVLPDLRVGGFVSRALSGWDAIGLGPQTQMTNDRGFLSLLAIVCLLAPLAIPFLKQTWARWLNAAPVAFLLVACIVVDSQMHSAASAAGNMGEELGGAAGREMAGQFGLTYSLAVGAYLALICAIYLLTRAFKGK